MSTSIKNLTVGPPISVLKFIRYNSKYRRANIKYNIKIIIHKEICEVVFAKV